MVCAEAAETSLVAVWESRMKRDPEPMIDRRISERREAVDFHTVRDIHLAVHERLTNWSRYVRDGRGHSAVAPMFRQFQSNYIWGNHDTAVPVDTLDGSRMEKAVGQLPEKHCTAIRWHYVYSARGLSVFRVCRMLAVRQDTLATLVHDARSMLKNRGA